VNGVAAHRAPGAEGAETWSEFAKWKRAAMQVLDWRLEVLQGRVTLSVAHALTAAVSLLGLARSPPPLPLSAAPAIIVFAPLALTKCARTVNGQYCQERHRSNQSEKGIQGAESTCRRSVARASPSAHIGTRQRDACERRDACGDADQEHRDTG